MPRPDLEKLAKPIAGIDWGQVRLNGGPPCFHVMDYERFCLRAERWDGHDPKREPDHLFVPLSDVLTQMSAYIRELEKHAEAMAEALQESHKILQLAGPNGPRAVRCAVANQESLERYRKFAGEKGGKE